MAIVQRQRTAPWIGIGVQGTWHSSAEALEAAELDFDVRREDLFWNREDPYDPRIVYAERAPMYANVRNTDDKLLGCVTPQYKMIQNREAFSLLDPFLGNGVITNAGMTEDGLVFMVARVGIKTIGHEDYMINLMATNSFNGKFPCQIIMTPVRIICQNMYRKLIPDRIFMAKHTTAVNERLLAIANGNGIEKKILAFGNIIESAQGKTMDRKQLEMLIAMLFPYPKEGGPREQTYKIKTDQARKMFQDIYYDAQDNIEHHGTAFGFINAYFDYLSHRDSLRETRVVWEDRRLSGLVSGNDIELPIIRAALR